MQAAQSDDLPVLLLGDPGSGKGRLARWIHANGPRSGRTFYTLNRKTPWEDQILEVNGGSLLFPEWETCSYPERDCLQRLLRFRTLKTTGLHGDLAVTHLINSRVFLPALRADAELEALMELSSVRAIAIDLPPLRERQGELLDLALALLHELGHDQRKDHVQGFEPSVSAALLAYDWPGNLRELRNVLSFALTRAQGEKISESDLPSLGDESLDFFASREEFERATLAENLRQCGGDLDRTARSLRVSREFLDEKMRRYRLASSLGDKEAPSGSS